MAHADSLKLVARLSGVGLLFDLADLLEVVDTSDAVWEPTDGESLGEIRFRDELLPVFDVHQLLEWGPAANRGAGSILVFRNSAAAWGGLVDEVVGIYPLSEFAIQDLPTVLLRPGQQSYRRLAMWGEEPLVCCELDLLNPWQDAA